MFYQNKIKLYSWNNLNETVNRFFLPFYLLANFNIFWRIFFFKYSVFFIFGHFFLIFLNHLFFEWFGMITADFWRFFYFELFLYIFEIITLITFPHLPFFSKFILKIQAKFIKFFLFFTRNSLKLNVWLSWLHMLHWTRSLVKTRESFGNRSMCGSHSVLFTCLSIYF